MTWLLVFARRLRGAFLRQRLDGEMEEELRAHLEMLVEENQRRGMSPERARYAALRQFGGVEQVKERYRRRRGLPLVDTTLQDLRYAVRMLLKHKGTTAVAVLSLALGIGANTALFSVTDAVLLKSLPVREPDQLVMFRWTAGQMFSLGMSGSTWEENGLTTANILPFPTYQELKDKTQTLENVCAFAPLQQISANAGGQTELAQGQIVTGNYFATLGVAPALGRLLEEGDDQVSAEPAVVISHRYWQRRFAADPQIIGRQIALNKKSFTVVGVTPPEFFGALNVGYLVDVTVPMASDLFPQQLAPETRKPDFFWALVMGRLKPGVTRAQAQEEISTLGNALLLETQKKTLDDADKPRLVLDAGRQGVMEARREFSTPLRVLLYVVLATLLIACLNIANLMLARAVTRRKEMAVRQAAGAARKRLIRQMLTESVLLSLIGGACGIVFAFWGKDFLVNFRPQQGGMNDLVFDAQINWHVLAYTASVAVVTGILFGLAPAWRASRIDLANDLKVNSHLTTGGNARLTKGFLAAQIALSLTLLIGAGLFLRTLRNLEAVDLGIPHEDLLLFKVQPELSGYKDENVGRLYEQISERVEALPGVRAVTHSLMPLIGEGGFSMPVKIVGGETKPIGTWIHHVRPNFFETLRIGVLAGRRLTRQDDARAPKVAVINRSAAKKLFDGESPLGKRISVGGVVTEFEIVGVVSDVKYDNLRKDAPATTYFSTAQLTTSTSQQATFTVRAAGDPAVLSAALRAAIEEVDPNLPVTNIRTQTEQNARTFAQEKLFAQLISFFGLLTLLLVCLGLYGMMSYSVTQRRREMGIRLALGASAGAVLRMVLRQGMIVVFLGIGGGGILAWTATRLLNSYLFGVSATSPPVFILTSVLLVSVALIACLIPAKRAALTDPMSALRSE